MCSTIFLPLTLSRLESLFWRLHNYFDKRTTHLYNLFHSLFLTISNPRNFHFIFIIPTFFQELNEIVDETTTRQDRLISLLASQVDQAQHQRTTASHNHLSAVHKLTGSRVQGLDTYKDLGWVFHAGSLAGSGAFFNDEYKLNELSLVLRLVQFVLSLDP